ncbi:MAG: hypothetical protein ABW138_19330, partial [Candidatus Thiodiazotropha sp. 4PDIVS1]
TPMQLIDHRPWFSYRGLTPHQFMPMLGVHKPFQRTVIDLRYRNGSIPSILICHFFGLSSGR